MWLRCALALSVILVAAPPLPAADAITVYRCTDARGQLTLRDSPCAKGEAQQTRSMQRPQDPPPASLLRMPASAPAMATPPPARVVVVMRTPQPLYECVTPEGTRYSSDSAEGNPRWVPTWALGDPLGDPLGAPIPASAYGGGIRYRNGTVEVAAGGGGGPYRGPGVQLVPWPAGMWVRDDCHALPQAEVCARLVDRRETLRRRFFNAQPSERATLDKEERAINARLAADCGDP